MGNTINSDTSPHQVQSHYHMIDANTVACPRSLQIAPHSLTPPTWNRMTNQCYFASVEETIDQPMDNQVMINLRASQQCNANQNNNNNHYESAITKL